MPIIRAGTGFPRGSDGKESACNAGDLGWEDPLEKAKAPHSSILACPWVAKSQTQLSHLHFHLELRTSI